MSQNILPINDKKTINAWCSYDISNSAYNLSIATVLYPIYYSGVTKEVFGSELVSFLGLNLKNTVVYEYAIALGYLLIIFLTLLLSGMADLGGYRKRFMQLFTFTGAFACMALYTFTGSNILLGIGLPALAVIGFAGSLVYYNSFLPLIASPDRHDKISAKGFSFGYAGSMLLLIFNLYTIKNFASFGFSSELQAVRFAFVEVGLWWLLISQFAFYYLKERRVKITMGTHLLTHGFNELKTVFKFIKAHSTLYRFLIAFFFFSMGVQTIIIIASLFGSSELGMESDKLILTILIIQVVAILGAWLFGTVSSKYGNKVSLLWMLALWILVCVGGFLIQNETQFYLMGAVVGLVMGGIQSQARSTWSKLMPKTMTNSASYFSFYDNTEKFAIVLGMLSFGMIEHITGSMRNSSLMLSAFFLVSLLIIIFTKFSTSE